MSNEIDVEEVWDEIAEAFEALQNGRKGLKKLQRLLEKLERFDPEFGEGFTDSEDLFSQGLNDAEFREDRLGSNALRDPEVFRLVQRFCTHNENIEVVLATSPHCPKDVLETLALSDFSWEEDGTTQALARNQHDPEFLRRLSESEDASTRFEVAANPATPVDVLMRLSTDPGYSESRAFMARWDGSPHVALLIQYAVAMNPATPESVLLQMRESLSATQFSELPPGVDVSLRQILDARIPATPVESLSAFAQSTDSLIRAAVAANPNSPQDLLVRLARDSDPGIRRALGQNPSSSDEVRTLIDTP